MTKPIVAVNGAKNFDEVPGLIQLRKAADFRFAPNGDALPEVLRGADIMLGWNFAAADLHDACLCAKLRTESLDFLLRFMNLDQSSAVKVIW